MGVIIYQRGAEKIFPKRFSRYRVGLIANKLQRSGGPGLSYLIGHVRRILFNLFGSAIPAPIRTLTRKQAGSMQEVALLLRLAYCPPYYPPL